MNKPTMATMATLEQFTNGIETSFPPEYQKGLEGLAETLSEMIQREQEDIKLSNQREGETKRIGASISFSSQELRALGEADEKTRYDLFRRKFLTMAEAHFDHFNYIENLEGILEIVSCLETTGQWKQPDPFTYQLDFVSEIKVIE